MKRNFLITPSLAFTLSLILGLTTAAAPAVAQRTTREQRAKQANKAFEKLAESYMQENWAKAKKQVQSLRRNYRFLDQDKREDFSQMRGNVKQFHPRWWHNVTSSTSKTFPASIWDRRFKAYYKPSRDLGAQSVKIKQKLVRTRDGWQPKVTDMKIIVTWKPNLVNNPHPADGRLAKRMGYKLEDLGQVIVWHELGHNFLTGSLSMQNNITLYTKYKLLFAHLQEFFADLTALYHTGPHARRAALQIRLQGLDYYDEEEPHTRAAHGIGALVLADILQHPKKWPSVHLPPKVPDKQVELNTIMYVYENWDKDWSLDEALRLRKLVHDFVRQRGDHTFRSKGVFSLPYGAKFSLMVAQDRAFQKKRNQWVAQRLKKLIASGRADKLEKDETYDPRYHKKPDNGQIIISSDKDDRPPRIEVPW